MPGCTAQYTRTVPYRVELDTPVWYEITNLATNYICDIKAMCNGVVISIRTLRSASSKFPIIIELHQI